MLTPGQYLRKRREAAGLTLRDVAATLVGLPFAKRATDESDRLRLVEAIQAAEHDSRNLSPEQAVLLRHALHFDHVVYCQLVAGLEPQLCSACACSLFDACVTDRGACDWSALNPNVCTACERAIAATPDGTPPAIAANELADWPDAPLPQGFPL